MTRIGKLIQEISACHAYMRSQQPGKKCFCGAARVALCAWPEYRFVITSYDQLVIGDRVRRHKAAGGDPSAKVVEVRDDGWGYYHVTVEKKNYRWKTFDVRGFSPVQVERLEACEAPMCELHMREVAEGRAYCQDHWHAWESVA